MESAAITDRENNLCPQKQHDEKNNNQLLKKNTNDKFVQEDKDHIDLDNMNPTSSKIARAKTPMCLINDLARFNKISFQYCLIGEVGLAHCKRFTVSLKLGDEEYTAEGGKVKEAQHLAAKEAIEKTKYKRPIPKKIRRSDTQGVKGTNITPTVELNALAMKLGQQTYYIFDPRQMTISENTRTPSETYKKSLAHELQSGQLMTPRSLMVNNESNPVLRSYNLGGTFVPNLPQNGGIKHSQHQWSYLPKSQPCFPTFQRNLPNVIIPTMSNPLNSTYFPPTALCNITLIVGTQKFIGMGRTLQQAKHDAAAKALQVLKEQLNTQQNKCHDDSIDDDENTSPISQVFEIGVKRNMSVEFKVLREEGPAHMRVFTTACIVGHIVTEGSGAGKKISKKNAAQKMLTELKKLPPLTSSGSSIKCVKMKTSAKKCVKNPTKSKEEQRNKNKNQSNNSDSPNFIAKLKEWHQQNNLKEPEFKLIDELGSENSRRRQYTMEVNSNNIVARGVGNSKKLAKLNAAHNFLLAIDTEKHDLTAGNSSSISNNEDTVTNRQVNQVFSTASVSTVIPNKTNHVENVRESQLTKERVEEPKSIENEKSIISNEATKPKEDASSPNLAQSIEKLSDVFTFPSVKNCGLSMKDQLMYLAKLMGFEVVFSDYPKGNHNEFLTIVMLSTNPPQICHGVGNNTKESQEDSAKNALKILSEMGLNNTRKS